MAHYIATLYGIFESYSSGVKTYPIFAIATLNNIEFDLTVRANAFDNLDISGELDVDALPIIALYDIVGNVIKRKVDMSDVAMVVISDVTESYPENQLYSCFARDIIVDGFKVSMTGYDFKRMLDTEMLFDYSSRETFSIDLNEFFVYMLSDGIKYQKANVSLTASTGIFIDPIYEMLPFDLITMPVGDDNPFVEWYVDIEYYFTANAWNLAKPLLNYYGQYLLIEFNEITKHLNSHIIKNAYSIDSAIEIKLKDFKFVQSYSAPTINRVVATKQTPKVSSTVSGKEWMETTQEYYERYFDSIVIASPTLPPASDYQIGQAVYWSTYGVYYMVSETNVDRSPFEPVEVYVLTKDNQIIGPHTAMSSINIPFSNRLYPVATRIYQSDSIITARMNAIQSLAESRYNENIEITDDDVYNPLDLSDIQLYAMVTIYGDVAGTSRTLPVSEIRTIYRAGEKKRILKLGFKKKLLTEIIKAGIR